MVLGLGTEVLERMSLWKGKWQLGGNKTMKPRMSLPVLPFLRHGSMRKEH